MQPQKTSVGGFLTALLAATLDYVLMVTFSSVFSCNVFKKCRFQAVSTRKRMKTKRSQCQKRFRFRLKSKYYIFVFWKLRSFIGSSILKLKTLATNKTKCIAF
jgi:hypothetical protein